MDRDVFILPMSFAQERLWFLAQLEPDSPAYNLAAAVRLRGPLDAALLERCLREIVARHEVLRSTFDVVDERPVQLVDPDWRPRLVHVDLSHASAATREAEAKKVAAREARQPFDLVEGPLLRLLLLRLAGDDHVLVWVVHHGVFDGWSTALVLTELAALYPAWQRAPGAPTPVTELPLQYGDVAHWQRERAAAGSFAAELSYWKERLDTPDALLELPTDRARPAVQRSRGARYFFRLSAAVTQRLRALAQREATTLYAVLLTGFKVLLARLSGALDVRVGTPVSNRSRAELERLIGNFANTVVLRSDLSGDPSFIELLGRVSGTVREALARQEVPFDHVVEAVRPARDLSHAPLCQVLFAVQPEARRVPSIPGLEVELVDVDVGGSQLDLALEFAADGEGLAGAIEYDTDLFDASSIERFAARLSWLLESALERGEARISELTLLEPTERALLLGWGRTATGTAPQAVHCRFHAQARRTPEGIAVVSGEQRVSYAELSLRVQRLARRLQQAGVRAESRVGICLPRSVEMVVAVLGVLEAGGAYVPLDPAYPSERLAAMVADAGIELVLAAPGTQEPFARTMAVDVPAVDDAPGASFARPAAEQAAYVIYTSGSTGTPKGVVVPHRAFSRFVDSALRSYELGPADRVLQFASLSFDASVEEIFPCLTSGATLVLRTEAMLASPSEFAAACTDQGITVLDLPTMYWHRLAAALPAGLVLPPSLRLVIIGGEAALPERLSDWLASRNARLRLVNTYGPTEATVVATACTLTAADVTRVPIGAPIAGARVLLLDAALEQVPPGVVGELYLGGEGLARGYLGRPALTAERFVPDRFSGEPGARLYRTGDRARFRHDGQLEFVGRVDAQVKLRGFRIEPGEVEARLAEQAGVRAAAVVVRAVAGEERLVGYASAGAEVTPEALRAGLRRTLPDYMVPAILRVLDELPRTSQGKIDRRALPEPEETIVAAHPENQTEAILARIWAELLKRPALGVRDNFFALGGDSIMALQVVARARDAGLTLEPRQMFQHQTVAELAAVAKPAAARSSEQSAALEGDVPLTPIQRWFFRYFDEQPHHFNQAVLLELRQATTSALLEAALDVIVQRHEALRLRFTRDVSGWRQRLVAEARAALTVVDLSAWVGAVQASELSRVAMDEQARLHVSDGPLIRAVLFELGASGRRLLMIAHHLVVDALSWRVLLEDLEAALGQLEAGASTQLTTTTVGFATWARQLSRAPEPDATSTPELPVDDLAGSELERDTVRFVQRLELAETARLVSALPAYRLRVDELLLTAVTGALSAWTGSPVVLIERESHGRDVLSELDVSRSVGWFTRLVPTELELRHDLEPARALITMKEQLRRAVPCAKAARISFNYLGQWDTHFTAGSRLAFTDEDVAGDRSPTARRAYELELDAAIVDGRLRMTWSYSGARLRQGTVQRLVDEVAARLAALIEHCHQPGAGSATPSDFPLAKLDAASFERLLGSARGLDDVYPLSPLQKGLLFHSLWEQGSGAYVEQVTCRLQGALDIAAFREAWQAVLAHHDALRTIFVHEGAEEPLQIVRKEAALELSIEQRRSGDHAEFAGLLARDRARGFDLSAGPLTRLTLVRDGDDAHVVLWSHHHLILDGWSAALVLRDVFAAYQAISAGRAPTLPFAPRFRDHIAQLQSHSEDASEAFWRQQLAGFPAATPLPFEQSLPAVEAGQGVATLRLPVATTARLTGFVQEQRITLSALLQGAWALILARAARSDDVLFGVTVAGRGGALRGIEQMVGLLINTLPLRVSVTQAAVVADWLRALLAASTELSPHEHTPLARARSWSSVPPGQPLFESLLVVENYPADPRLLEGAPGLRVSEVSFADQTSYALTLSVMPGAELGLRLAYDCRRFDPDSAERLIRLVASVLGQLVSHATKKLSELPLLAPLEARKVLELGNDTQREYPAAPWIHELIEAQSAQTPDATALIFENQRMSYDELDRRANQVAHALRKRGVRPDVLVAIAAERSIELVVGLLGILKAGGAYVPIDPDYPGERIAFMLEDAGASVLLSQWPVASRLPAHGASLLCLDSDRSAIEAEPTTKPAVTLDGENLAYTIYTSGSTGRPKGAGNRHAGLRNRLLWMQERYGLRADDRVLQKTPFSFDVSVWEFFWPLMAGATLVVARPGDHRDGERLIELIRRDAVTTLHFVPPMLQAFLSTPGAAECTSLRRVICSGEALPAELVRRFFETSAAAELHNLYGPTEASIDVTEWECRREHVGASVPIGRAIANTRMYVLDRQGHPVPPGMPGELHIGGIGLARGYHERRGLTAERFVPDPFGTSLGGRLYRTGDLARHRPDGAIEFLGRLDHQIKIRGLRVELGEIEARLLQHPEVREAVVIARELGHGGKQLVGYVAGSEALALEDLSTWLGATLPAHMVPGMILVLPALPLSPNGKVDRRALPAPEATAAVRVYEAPRNAAEQLLVEIWAQVLHVERVGIQDDFFALGGDSIVTLQVVARAQQHGLRLTPRDVFEHPTVAALAARVTDAPVATAPPPSAVTDSPSADLSAEEWRDLLDELAR
jgi:amino acid adenylation domain-containing protein/non-ribosomal peptide synthase protein (TIGR01720 family)